MKASPIKFMAEVSSNHHRDLDRCCRFIDGAAQIGCQAVKFQLFRIDQLFAPEILAKSQTHRDRRAWELPDEFLPELAKRCRRAGIGFSCTPFYLEAVEKLLPHVDFYKIASYELLWDDLLTKCARTGKPVVLSTGMATGDEIAHAVQTLRQAGCDKITLLHCVSSYPTPVGECNLAAMEDMRKSFACPVGWSDHSASPAVIKRAVHRWQAAMVEFHLDIDGQGEEFGVGHCWLPEQMKAVIAEIRDGFSADGNGMISVVPSETTDREWRADPEDGLRPLRRIRESFSG